MSNDNQLDICCTQNHNKYDMIQKGMMLRIMKYKRILIQLRSLGLERVFSNNLGDAIGVSATLVRKDLARVGMQGNRRGGYAIDTMLDIFNHLLGGKKTEKIILVGCGNLGRALLNHTAFAQEGIKLLAGFDLSPLSSEIGGTPIYSMEHLESYIRESKVEVALLAVPAVAAAEARDSLIGAGIRGILNFAPTEFKSTTECIIHNVSIGLEIENLFYMVNSLEDNPSRDREFPVESVHMKGH